MLIYLFSFYWTSSSLLKWNEMISNEDCRSESKSLFDQNLSRVSHKSKNLWRLKRLDWTISVTEVDIFPPTLCAWNIQVTFVLHHHQAYVFSKNFLFNQTFPLIQGLCIVLQLTNCWNFPKLLRELFITFSLSKVCSIFARLLNSLRAFASFHHEKRDLSKSFWNQSDKALTCWKQIWRNSCFKKLLVVKNKCL